MVLHHLLSGPRWEVSSQSIISAIVIIVRNQLHLFYLNIDYWDSDFIFIILMWRKSMPSLIDYWDSDFLLLSHKPALSLVYLPHI